MKYKKYPSYKDSGVEWLGEIPTEWINSKLKYHAFIYNGNSISDNEKSAYENLDKETSIPYVSTKDIDSNFLTINYDNGMRVSNDDKFKRAKKGSTLICIEGGSAGKKLTNLNKDVCFVNKLACIDSYNKLDNRYAYYITQSSIFKYSFNLATTGLIPGVSINQLKDFEIIRPPFKEQQQIAKFLDNATQKMDTLIQKQENLIKLLKEKRQAVISHAVTRGLNPDVKFKDSGVEWLGDVPEHWGITPLRYIGRFQNGISKGAEYFGSGFPFINYGDIYKNAILPFKANGLAKSTKEDQNIYSVKKGDVFFTRTSETINDIGMASTCLQTIENATFSGFTIRFRQLKFTLNEQFSKYYFRTGHSQSFFEEQLNLVTRASLGQDILKQLPVLVPTLQEQQEIATYLDDKTKKIDKLIKKAIKSIKLLKEKRTALISAAVTGKIDVRELV